MSNIGVAEQSIARYEDYLKVDPHNALLWLSLGDLYHRTGRLDEAIASYERAQIESPGMPAARSGIASVYISQHRFDQAESLLRDLVEENDQDLALLYNLGLARFYQDKWRAACDSFSRALERGLRSNDNLAYLTRTLHHLGKTREALEFCGQWAQQAGDNASQGYLALLEMDEGNMARAQKLAQEVLARDPARAEQTFHTAIAADRGFAEAHGGLASALALQIKVTEAQVAARVADRLDPANFGAKFAQTVLLKIQGKNDAAQRLLARVLEHAPVPHSKPLIEHLRLYGSRQLKSTPPLCRRPPT